MADIAVATAGSVHVVESLWQKTLVATEAIAAGAPVRIHTDGKWTNANGTTTTENRIWGIATKSVVAGEALTAVRRGTLDGFTFSQAYDAIIYLSDTDGRLGDVAGTVSTIVGRVVPGTAVVGTTYDKLLSVEL
jgi:hypothetical protein